MREREDGGESFNALEMKTAGGTFTQDRTILETINMKLPQMI